MVSDSKIHKKKSFFKRIFISIAIFLVFLVVAIVVIPYFFQDDIKKFVVNEINDNIEAKVEFGDIDLSLFKDFPNLNTSLSDLNIIGQDSFSNDTLVKIKKLELVMDIMSVFSNKIDILNFMVTNPKINLIIDKDGKSNFDIVKEGDKNSHEEKSKLKDIVLQHYSIINGDIVYRDLQTKKFISISGFDHKGSGNFRDIKFKLKTESIIDELNFKSEDITLLKKVNIAWNINFDIDLNDNIFTIQENTLNINELKLVSVGQFQMKDEYLDINLKLNAPGNSFKEIYSVIPNAYIEDFRKIKTSGNFNFIGDINGKYYFDKEIYPDFNFNIKTSNGYVKSPDMSLPLKKIDCDISISKKGESLDNMVVNISPLTFKVEEEKMFINLLIKNIASNPVSKGKFKGNLNLGVLSKAFPIKDLKEMSGKLVTDINFNYDQTLDKKVISGFSEAQNIKIDYSNNPKVSIKTAKTKFNNNEINISELIMDLGKSDISGNIKIQNPLNYFVKNKPISIEVNGNSQFFDADEWLTEDSNNSNSKLEESDTEIIDLLKNRIRVDFNYKIGKLNYEDFDLKNISFIGNYSRNSLNIKNQKFVLSGSDFSMNARLNNIISWVLENEEMKGNIYITSPYFNADMFMGEEPNNENVTTKSENEAFEIPDKMNLEINTSIAQLDYTGKNLKNITGQLKVKEQKLIFNNMEARGMGGTMHINGLYSTPPNKPAEFDINYKMSNIKYEDMYNSVVTYKVLAPVTKFISGIFNATFSFKGKMKDGFTPDFSSINASGLIHTLNAYIKNYPALSNLASKLQVKSLESIKIEDSKNRFDIVNGAVKINPFDVKYDDMLFNISGINKLDKTIDYLIHAKIPRSKIGKIPGEKNIQKGLDFISSEAKAKGINFEIGNDINLDFSIVGKYDKPKIKVSFVSIENSGKDGMEDKALKSTNSEVDKAKKKAKDKTDEVLNSTKDKTKKVLDKKKKELKKNVKKELKNVVDSTTKKNVKDKVKDVLKDLWK